MFQKSYLFTSILILFSILTINGQNKNWKEVKESELISKSKFNRENFPKEYKLFEVDYENLKSKLFEAPNDLSGVNSNTILSFPDAEGNLTLFKIYETQLMEEELAVKFPEIKNFTAINLKDPTNVIKVSITPAFGMHIMGFDGNFTTYYIDTFTQDFSTFIYYKRKNIENTNPSFQCLAGEIQKEYTNSNSSSENFQIQSTDQKFRRYRMAMACTTEYAQFHLRNAPTNISQNTEQQKKQIVLSAMNVTINRLNSIYERDLAVRLVLVGNNDAIIFITSDNFTNGDPDLLIDESQSVITRIIGTNNFDIGHTVSTGAGGLASPAPCYSIYKALGVTGTNSPVGDPFDIDFVAHEVAHQFGANHTFNNSCQNNRYNQTAVEPGSGSTILSYAGICFPNVQNNSDAYFHQISIQEITDFLQSSWNNCATIISTANATPVITGTSGNKTIPNGTPFILTVNATDSNNPNSLTYTWEQMDNTISTQAPLASSTVGPNFRSIAPSQSPSRSFPSTETVLAGTTNANGIVSSTWERLPVSNSSNQSGTFRTMKFATTVRDNNPLTGGQTKSENVTITFSNAGPFVITYPNNITTTSEPNWSSGDQKNITWNVAGTNANGINTTHVNILLSEDNGLTYPHILKANTPNDGNEVVIIPNLESTENLLRVKIEAVGNIFYTVSKPIGINLTASNSDFDFENFKLYPNPTSDAITISFNSTTGKLVSMDVYDIRGRKLESFTIENFGTIEKELNLSNYESGVYLVKITDGENHSTKKIIKK